MAKPLFPTLFNPCPLPPSGLLFVGDPHAWSRNPGRRMDKYTDAVLNKLAAAVKIANEQNLLMVCLGDLMHEAGDHDLAMLSRMVEIFKRLERPMLCAVGNHDLTERQLTRGTALELLEQSGALTTLRFNAPYAYVELLDAQGATCRVLLGATPYGDTIPASLAAWTGKARALDHAGTQRALQADAVVWITHEDLAFDHRYPGAIDTHPITGVDLVVNGHMHLNQKPIRRGNTCWYNPGNISRLTIDLAEQTPRVWRWTPNDSRTMVAADGLEAPLLEAIDLPHTPSEQALSLMGRATKQAQLEGQSAQPMEPDAADDLPATGIASSRFVERLREDQSEQRTDDGVFLSQTVQEVLALRQAPEHVSKIVGRLMEKALEQHREKQQ
jgi:hypothetical protein